MPHANPLTKLQNTIFSPKIFSQQFIDKLKFEEMEYIIYDVWNVNSLTLLSYRLDFKQWNLYLDITFPNSSINLDFWDFGIFECCSGWASQIFHIYERDRKLGFLI